MDRSIVERGEFRAIEMLLAPHWQNPRGNSATAAMRGPTLGRLASLVVVAFVVLGSQAHAEMDARTFLKRYDQGSLEIRALYARQLGATENGMSWANSAAMHDHGFYIYCPPDNLALADDQNIDIMRRHLIAHPEFGKLPFGLVLLTALKETFPCK
jgi:hypothetical protein